MNERLRAALQRKIAAHNRLVTLTIVSSCIAVVAMWVALYFLAHWFLVALATVVKGVEAEAPQHVSRTFAIAVIAEFAAFFLAHRAGFYQRLRDERGVLSTGLELCLLPARATFGTIQNLRNRIRFDETDLSAATDFLVRVVRAGKLPASSVPVDLPSEGSRKRVLHALQLLDLIYLRRGKAEDYYSVSDPQRLVPFL